MRVFLLPIYLIFFINSICGQHAEVLKATNIHELNRMAIELEAEFIESREIAFEKARRLNIKTRIEHEDGSISELAYFEGDLPIFTITNNRIAAISTSTSIVQKGGNSAYELSGKDLFMGEWDGGAVRITHQEFENRVIQRDGAGEISNHATHVAGTLVGAGVRADAQGMAPEAILWAHDWNSDNAEMADAASRGLLVSNHSYGTISGWANGDWAVAGTNEWHWWGDVNISPVEDYKFGFYDGKARTWDQIAFNAPHYLIVKSAGNDRSNVGALNHKVRIGGNWESSSEFRPRDGGTDGYDCLPTYSTAKNILTVGAVNDLPNGYTGPGSVSMSNFSSWGPTDDGRIKPDIVGNGVGLTSSTSGGDNTYGSLSGTSMSGPNVAGSLLLLQELYERYHGTFMRASTLKGLVIQTADEAGSSPGPDYRFGWGLLNTHSAANTIHEDGVFQFIDEAVLENNQTYETQIISNGTQEVKITLCWTDPAGNVISPALNDRRLKLINDLDMRLISDDDPDLIYFPYTLDPENPANIPTQQDNFRDNVEQIYAGILPAGKYNIVISHKSTLTGNSQPFSLISNTPKVPCQLGIAERQTTKLSCNSNVLDSFSLNTFDPELNLKYSIDGENFTQSNTFYDLSAGKYNFLVKDENGCIGIQRLEVAPHDNIQIDLIDAFVLELKSGLHQYDVQFNNSFNNGGWGGNPNNIYITASCIYASDASANPTQGCNDLINADEMVGKIVFFDRGGCEFGAKAIKAQNAGALAVVIINNASGLVEMGPGVFGSQIQIPVFMFSQESGQAIRNDLTEGNLSMRFGLRKSISNASCDGSADAFLRPSITAGSGDYYFDWNSGHNGLELEYISAGVYILSVTDQEGCINTFEFMIQNEPEPTLSISIENETCQDQSDGSLNIQNFNSLQQFYIQINGELTNQQELNLLPPGNYQIDLIHKDNLCVYNFEFEISPGVFFELSEINGDKVVSSGNEYTYAVEPIENAVYNWTITGGIITGGQSSPQITVLFEDEIEIAEISIEVTLSGCSEQLTIEIEVEESSASTNVIEQQFNLFPNPVKDQLFLNYGNITESQVSDISIFSISGIIQFYQNGRPTNIDIKHLLPGYYLLKFQNTEMVIWRLFIKV